jgi:hypothetical protein
MELNLINNNLKPNKMTTEMTVHEIIDAINAMDENELVYLNNAYCHAINAPDSEIFGNDEDFFDTFFSSSPMRLAQAICYGNYHYYDQYVFFNGYGNLETFQNMTTDQLCELVPTMAEYIAENIHEFYNIF